MASKKQLAARRRFSQIMKSGGFKRKSSKKLGPKRRISSTSKRISKTIKRRNLSNISMAKRSRGRSIIRRGSKGIKSSLQSGLLSNVVKGIGGGALVGTVMNRIVPNSSITPLASIGAGFLFGGVVGGAANLVLSGGLNAIGGIFGNTQASAPLENMGV